MIRSLLIALLLGSLFASDGPSRWRDGDRAFREADYERAVEAYTEALSHFEGDAPRQYRLLNNIGAALYRLGRADEAKNTYRRAAEIASNRTERANSAYNAGTSALASAHYKDAVRHLRDALVADPSHVDARHNLEVALRRTPPEQPSESMMDGDDDAGADDEEAEESESGQTDDEDDATDQSTDEADDSRGDAEPGDGEDYNPSEGDAITREEHGGRPEPALTREQAERLLQALEQGEQEAVREVRRAPAPQRRVERDW
jgi:Ca-activated chloride channel homolog